MNIPQADVFFVAGEVIAPGSFRFEEGMTERQAILLARGPTAAAKVEQVVIFREDPTTSKRQEIKVDFRAVLSGKEKDVTLQPNDIIIVPSNGAISPRPPRFMDSPIRLFLPCRGSRPCISRLDLNSLR